MCWLRPGMSVNRKSIWRASFSWQIRTLLERSSVFLRCEADRISHSSFEMGLFIVEMPAQIKGGQLVLPLAGERRVFEVSELNAAVEPPVRDGIPKHLGWRVKSGRPSCRERTFLFFAERRAQPGQVRVV